MGGVCTRGPMTNTKWLIKGRQFSNCNCAYGCPCQFNALPTHGNCRGFMAVGIEKGHHGTVKLDGLRFVVMTKFPGAIHEGHGVAVVIVDERATEPQRDALLRIASGYDTQPGATIFQVLSSMLEKVHDPIFAPIDFAVDIAARQARLKVPNHVDARAEPIRNAVTGEESRSRINLPDGFEFIVAEVGRGWLDATDPLTFTLADSHAHFAEVHMTGNGVIH
jgi:hypothetical protein